MNITGSFLNSKHPMKVHIENITIDYFKFTYFYATHEIEWNYPEAFLEPSLYFNNIVVENSNPYNVVSQTSVIRTGDHGNMTVTNLDWTKWFYSTTADSSWFIYVS